MLTDEDIDAIVDGYEATHRLEGWYDWLNRHGFLGQLVAIPVGFVCCLLYFGILMFMFNKTGDSNN